MPQTKEMQGSLMQKTIQLMKDDSRSLATISMQCGLSFYWLNRLSTGEVKDPSVNRIQKLYEFLTNSKLEV